MYVINSVNFLMTSKGCNFHPFHVRNKTMNVMGFFGANFFLARDILRIQNQLSLLLLQFVQPFFIK